MELDEEWWDRLAAQIDRLTSGDPAWRPGVDPREIDRAEAALGVRLPEDYVAFLLRHDGQDEEFGVSILSGGGRLAPLEVVVRRHEQMLDWFDDEGVDFVDDKDRVRGVVFHSRRIDVGGSIWFDGDNTVLDMIPGPAGHEGQLLVGVSEGEYALVGESFSDYLRRIVVALEGDLLTFRDDRPVENIALASPTKYRTRCERTIRKVPPSID